MSDTVKHPLEELVEQWEKRESNLDDCCAVRVSQCADELSDVLKDLWHRFDPNDSTTWPKASGRHLVIYGSGDCDTDDWNIRGCHGWYYWGNSVTHYTELLPAPKGDK